MSCSKFYRCGLKMDVVLAFTEAAVKSVGDCVGFFHVAQTHWQHLGYDLPKVLSSL